MAKPTNKPSAIWVTRDGRALHMPDMDDDHLANTIAMVERTFGPELLIYEMAQALLTEGFSAKLEAPTHKNKNLLFWKLMSLRYEQRKRKSHDNG